MDFSENSVLKEDYTFLAADRDGQVPARSRRGREDDDQDSDSTEVEVGAVAGGGHEEPPRLSEWGLYNRDTRFLSTYAWRIDPSPQTLLRHSPRPDILRMHLAVLEGHGQRLSFRRELRIRATGLDDTLEIGSTSRMPEEVELELRFDADFADLFEVRGWGALEREVGREARSGRARFAYRSRDGLGFATDLEFSPAPDRLAPGSAHYRLRLEPGETKVLRVATWIENPLEPGPPERGSAGLPDYDEWRRRFVGLRLEAGREGPAARAVDDLRALLLATPDGPVPAAGIPWYVAAFGRDALLTAALLLPRSPDLAEATLRYLARWQGTRHDGFRAEAPGKIMHELRFGEMARTGRVPHTPYYGTVDATPLFVALLGKLWESTGSVGLVEELRPAWEGALEWMLTDADPDGDGFLEFVPAEPGKGLGVQSWKDSPDSMSHADGSLASGAIAVSEVQGYAYGAYRAAAAFYRALGEPGPAEQWNSRAEGLREAFERAFWLDDLGIYAMALDGSKNPLRVLSSDAGQLLWSGIVPRERAERLVATLFSERLWSGWGFRTLGSGEVRYDPVSYHNGSVWPHDCALIAQGLARYGFDRQAARVREALLDLAASQPDQRLPELVAGYPRRGRSGPEAEPPVPYPVACRPQAWDAAALIAILQL